jgi:hypothetical protein
MPGAGHAQKITPSAAAQTLRGKASAGAAGVTAGAAAAAVDGSSGTLPLLMFGELGVLNTRARCHSIAHLMMYVFSLDCTEVGGRNDLRT